MFARKIDNFFRQNFWEGFRNHFAAFISEIKDVQFADFVFETHQNDLAKSPNCSGYKYKTQVSLA